MIKLFSFVGPVFRALAGGANYIAGAADKNPKANATITSMITLAAGVFGISSVNMASVGSLLVKLGKLMGG